MSTIGEIFEIPAAVHSGDFVLRLNEGLQADRRKETLRQYVVTKQLVECFDQAMGLIGSSVESRSSKGAYLHGSFGSGKSHFMAVLNLILAGDTDARSIPELAGIISKHNRWWEGGKFLVVPFHLIGAESLESAILGGYAEHVRALHPEAPTPGFYRSGDLLASATSLRETLGEDKFFEKLSKTGGGGWGALDGWDSASYAAAVALPPEDTEHQRLVGDLIDAFFPHVRTDHGGSKYVDLDRGLSILSRHAKSLGYTAVVLFLDELILWLASHAQDVAFLSREGPKVSKLVEAQNADRPAPLISFIARQRDLRELVGQNVPGAQALGFADVLQFWEARFAKVMLEDRNLPAIIERRLLRPRGEPQREALRKAFEQTAAVRREVLDILLTRDGDKQMFEKVYPFSPALVQVLVALSSMLQRERTALKLLLQLLVQNRDRLELGGVIPLGELFDVIIDGDEPFTAAIKVLFDRARETWRQKFRPMLEAEHEVSDQEVRDGTADPQRARRYRADAGLLKTLLLTALAPGVEALHGLTPLRLAALNHGTVKSPLPNAEASTVLGKVKAWAARAGEIQLSGDSANPVISLQLTGVDVESVVENALSHDNYGNRVRTVRSLLFDDIGLDGTASTVAPILEFTWRGTTRRVEILLLNVRQCTDDNLRPGDDAWRLVIDYPFDDDPRYGPADDRARLNKFRGSGDSARTVGWLPSFLTDRALGDLRRLGILNYLMSPNRLEECAAHLPPAERNEARAIIKNQRDALEQRMRDNLKAVYGIAQGTSDAVHTTFALDEHFESMATGLRLRPPPGGTFKSSVQNLAEQALEFQFPGHPKFEGELIKRQALKRAWEALRAAVDSPDGRYGMERAYRDEIRRVVIPLNLATCGEAHLHVGDYWRNHFTQKMSAAGVLNPTVRQLREWMDEPRAMGLPTEISDLVIMTWAAQTGRTAYIGSAPIPMEIGSLNREYELREEALPPEEQWTRAVRLASELFGAVGTGAGRNAANVSALAQALADKSSSLLPRVREYRDGLMLRLKKSGLDTALPRMTTVSACQELLIAISSGAASDRISALARATIETSAPAMAAVMAKAQELVRTLQSREWRLIETLSQRPASDARARPVLDAVKSALQADEHVVALAAQLSVQHEAALALLNEPAPTPPVIPVPPAPAPQPTPLSTGVRQLGKRSVKLAEMREVVREVEQALASNPKLRVDIECRIYDPDADGEASA